MIHNNQTLEIEPEIDREDSRLTQTRIRIRIPEKYHQEPVISNLISQEGLKVTINAAVLGSNAKGDGWFNLLLEGSPKQINSALIYLSDLDVEVWHESSGDRDGW